MITTITPHIVPVNISVDLMILDAQKSEKIYKAFFASIWSSLHPNIAITTLDTIKFSPKLEKKSFAKLKTLQGNCCKHDTIRYNTILYLKWILRLALSSASVQVIHRPNIKISFEVVKKGKVMWMSGSIFAFKNVFMWFANSWFFFNAKWILRWKRSRAEWSDCWRFP